MELDTSLDKIALLLSETFDRSQLEALGRSLNAFQLAALWHKAEYILQHDHDKLTALLVGMAPATFSELLSRLDTRDLEVFRPIAQSEPLLHHLTLHAHTLQQAFAETEQSVNIIKLEISQLEPQLLETSQLEALSRELENLASTAEASIKDIGRALSLAWNSGRAELVNKLSALKEQYERYSRTIIGSPRRLESNPQGLYLRLEEQLALSYGVPGSDSDALHDDDPAIEALGKLSIWYLDDFYEVGLLKATTSSYTQWRDAMAAVERQLARLGLHTVGDLKKAWICSRSTLTKFLHQHSHI